MRGRRPKPDEVHALNGNPGKRKRQKQNLAAAPAGNADVFQPPAWLDAIAKAQWRMEAPTLQRVNLMRETDRTAFATYCAAFSRYRVAQAVVKKSGMTYTTVTKHGSMERIRPEVKILQDAEKTMRAFMVEFGTTPSSRTRINSQKAHADQPLLPGIPSESSQQSNTPGGAEQSNGPIGMLRH
jgi:P27 family predicted phage terminase small subunit